MIREFVAAQEEKLNHGYARMNTNARAIFVGKIWFDP